MLNLLQVVFPVFGLIGAGYVANRAGWLQAAHAEVLNRFVYYLSFPALLFDVIARTPRSQIVHTDFLVSWTTAMLAGYAVTSVVSFIWKRDGLGAAGVRAMNSTCGNTAMMGIPLCLAAFGKEAQLEAVLATTAIVVIDISFTVALIETGRRRRRSDAEGPRLTGRLILALVRNPLMIGVALGAACSTWYGAPPAPLEQLCALLGAAAVPCSLVATGLFFAGHTHPIKLADTSALSFMKLFVQPLIAWGIASALGLDHKTAGVLIVLSALPPASMCFVIAQRYGTLLEETSSMTIVSTFLSVATLSVLLLWV